MNEPPSRPRPSAVRLVLIAVAIVSALALSVLLIQVWLLVFAGLLLAVLLSTAADAVTRWTGSPRGVSLAVTLLALILTLGGATFALWPSISEQADELTTRLPAAWAELRGWIDDRPWGEWLVGRIEPGRVVSQQDMVNQATSALSSTATAFGGVVVMLFIGIYVAAEPSLYLCGMRRLLPETAHGRYDRLTGELGDVLRWWLVGKLLSMTVVGVVTTAGLWLLGVPLALAFGLIAAALTFVPNIGPVLSVVPPVLLAVTDEPVVAGYVVLLYLVVQAVESYAITPLIQKRTVSLPPALPITAQVALGILVGPVGIAVATPLTAATMTAVRVLYVEDHEEASVVAR